MIAGAIGLTLNDFSRKALSSDALPPDPPDLSQWMPPSGDVGDFNFGGAARYCERPLGVGMDGRVTAIFRLAESIVPALEDLRAFVAETQERTGGTAFREPNMASALDSEIAACVARASAIPSERDPAGRVRSIQGLREKVVNDLAFRGDGCPPDPDANDWIVSCE